MATNITFTQENLDKNYEYYEDFWVESALTTQNNDNSKKETALRSDLRNHLIIAHFPETDVQLNGVEPDLETRKKSNAFAIRIKEILSGYEQFNASSGAYAEPQSGKLYSAKDFVNKNGSDGGKLIPAGALDIPSDPTVSASPNTEDTGGDQPSPQPIEVPTISAEDARLAQEQTKQASDSDQCKLFRLYEPMQRKYFEELSSRSNKNLLNSDILKLAKNGTGKSHFSNMSFSKNKSSGAMHLFYLKNYVYSSLVPNINLFKVVKGSTTGKVEKIYEIEFPESLQGFGNRSTPKFTESAYNTDGNPDGALFNQVAQIGVKSFSWKFTGTDRFTSERDIEAEITIVAESLEAFFAERVTSRGSNTYRISDLIFLPSCINPNRLSSLSRPSGRNRTGISAGSRTKFKPECYEIIANVGFNTNINSLNILKQLALEATPNLSSDRNEFNSLSAVSYYNGLENTLKDEDFSRMMCSLNLTVVDHQIDLRDNGYVEIKINYRGRLEGTLRDPRYSATIPFDAVLNTTEIDDFGSLAPQRISAKYLSSAETLYSSVVTNAVGSGQSGEASTTDASQGGFLGSVGSFFSNLFGDTTENGSVSQTDQKFVNLKDFIEEVEDYMAERRADIDNGITDSSSGKSAEEEIKDCQDLLNNVYQIFNSNFFDRLEGVLTANNRFYGFETLAPEARSYLASNPNSRTLSAFVSALERDLSQIKSNAFEGINAELPFVFFGDLVDGIMETIRGPNKTGKLEEVKIVFGNVMMPSSKAGFSLDPKTYVPINISAIPISYDLMKAYFAKILSEKKDKYPFMSFMRDLLNELVKQAFGISCIDEDKFPKYRHRMVNITDFGTYLKNISKTDIFLNMEELSLKLKTKFDIDSLKSNPSITNAGTSMLFISFEPRNFSGVSSGDFVEDFNNGIPHFRYKSDHGIFKKISLSKVDQPFVKEARFARQGTENVISQLTNVYDASFDMVGNDLLTLGDLIWIDSTSLASSLGDPNDPESLSFIMGFGGLHLVTELSHNITESGLFETKVKARFVSRGDVDTNAGG